MAFRHLVAQAPDPLLSLIELFAHDTRAHKIDLSVGIYRDDAGTTPVFAAVKRAERELVEKQGSKSYLGSDGDREYVELLLPLIFGAATDAIVGLQTPGGTGALRIAAELFARDRPGRRIWLGMPSWPNHEPIFRAAGLDVRTYRYLDPTAQAPCAGQLFAALAAAEPGDAVLLQASCHNPTGIDPEPALWTEIVAQVASRGLVPLIDFAYQGLGDGMDADARALRGIVAAVPEALVAYSCDKNFGLYRDRVGALFFKGRNAVETQLVQGNLLAIARASYSMPPDHGAAVVRTILSSTALRALWRAELDGMRDRIKTVRATLAATGQVGEVDLSVLADHRGMFSMLPLTLAQVRAMRAESGIYMADSGRINLAGLTIGMVPAFVAALDSIQRRAAA